MDNKEYGVIHEIGDYSAPRKLSEEDNQAVNEQLRKDKDNKDARK